MSSDRSREIVRILESRATWTTASQIASQVGCSSRTVKSDITALNRTHEGMIVASSKGYRIEDAAAAARLLSQQTNEVPQTAEARKRFILFELLMRHRKVRAADLAESLYISLATLDNELVAIKRELSGYGLVLRSRAGSLYIEGSAAGEKKMVNQLIFQPNRPYQSLFPQARPRAAAGAHRRTLEATRVLYQRLCSFEPHHTYCHLRGADKQRVRVGADDGQGGPAHRQRGARGP